MTPGDVILIPLPQFGGTTPKLRPALFLAERSILSVFKVFANDYPITCGHEKHPTSRGACQMPTTPRPAESDPSQL